MRFRSFHAILALLLLLAQTGLLLHEMDIAAHADDSDSCVICLMGQGLGHVLSEKGLNPVFATGAIPGATPALPPIARGQLRTGSPRAPPLTSLHS